MGTRSKTGKHGHAKSHIVGIDLFTGRRLEALESGRVSVPEVNRDEYQVINVGQNGALSVLVMPSCEMKVDLSLPTETEDDQQLSERIRRHFENGKIITVYV